VLELYSVFEDADAFYFVMQCVAARVQFAVPIFAR
jgi:hypothetical protein